MKLKRRSFLIALSGASCAVAVIFLTLGNWFSFLTLACYLFAEAALMLPLAAGSRRAGLLTYLAAVLLGFLFGGIWNPWRMFLFCVFFGLHPLANSMQEKWKLNKWVAFAIKAVWFDVALWLTWQFAYAYFFDASVNWVERIGNWIFLIIGAGGTFFFFFFDWAVRRMQNVLKIYVERLGGKGAAKRRPPTERRVEDVFGEEPLQSGAPSAESGAGQAPPVQDPGGREQAEGAPPGQSTQQEKAGQAPPAQERGPIREEQGSPPQDTGSTEEQGSGETRENEKREDWRENGEDR